MDRPDRAMCEINAQYYRIGLRGRPYVHRNGDWVLSSAVTSDEVKRAHREENKRKNKGDRK